MSCIAHPEALCDIESNKIVVDLRVSSGTLIDARQMNSVYAIGRDDVALRRAGTPNGQSTTDEENVNPVLVVLKIGTPLTEIVGTNKVSGYVYVISLIGADSAGNADTTLRVAADGIVADNDPACVGDEDAMLAIASQVGGIWKKREAVVLDNGIGGRAAGHLNAILATADKVVCLVGAARSYDCARGIHKHTILLRSEIGFGTEHAIGDDAVVAQHFYTVTGELFEIEAVDTAVVAGDRKAIGVLRQVYAVNDEAGKIQAYSVAR